MLTEEKISSTSIFQLLFNYEKICDFYKKYRILTLKCLIPSNPYVVTNHHLSYQNPPVFFTKTLHFKNPRVFSQNTSFYIKHLNRSNYKTCLYNLFVYLYTKNTKDPPVFFHKNTTFFKNPHVFSQKHFLHKNTTFHIKTLKSE